MTNIANKQRILVVDDERTNRAILKEILTPDNEVVLVEDGAQALGILDTEDIDLILLDIMMPEMSGYAVCEELNNNPKTMDIPVIFISALGHIQDKLIGLKHGGSDFITKPFQPEEILVRVKTHLKICSLQKELEAAKKEIKKLKDS
ncbi:response regulator [Pseudodesulfovibrio sp.]|nr:response regulator [Pseudodesulfovibrio sp.]